MNSFSLRVARLGERPRPSLEAESGPRTPLHGPSSPTDHHYRNSAESILERTNSGTRWIRQRWPPVGIATSWTTARARRALNIIREFLGEDAGASFAIADQIRITIELLLDRAQRHFTQLPRRGAKAAPTWV